MSSVMITHSLADLDALATEEDRAKARGFIERSAITVMGGLPPRELARVHEVTPLTGPEQELVTSWSAPDSWLPGARHPGRGEISSSRPARGWASPSSAPVEPSTRSTTPTRPSALVSRGGRDEPRAGAQTPARCGQRRARLDGDRRLLGAGRTGLAGLGRGQDRRRAGRRPGPAVRFPLVLGPGARPDRPGLARHPDPPGHPGRCRPGCRAGRRRGQHMAGSSPGASPSPATRSPRSARTGPSASSPTPSPPRPPSGCGPRWPPPGRAACPPPRPACCWAA